MEARDRDIASRLRIAVGHADGYRFLKTKDVAKICREIPEHRKFGRTWIAEDCIDMEPAQQIEGDFAHGPGGSSFGGNHILTPERCGEPAPSSPSPQGPGEDVDGRQGPDGSWALVRHVAPPPRA